MLVLLLLVGNLILNPSLGYALSPDEIVKKADEGRIPPGDVVFTALVKDFENGKVIHETKYRVSNRAAEASLVETIFPERQKGRKLLMDADSLWFYTPDLKRPARVSMQQKLTGEISNGDLARTNFSGDYKATLVEDKSVDGALHFSLAAKNSGVTYSKIDYWVSKNGFIPMKAVFYATSGKPLKMGTYSNAKQIMGKMRITKITMQDYLNKKRVSILEYSRHKKGSFSASTFSKDGLDE